MNDTDSRADETFVRKNSSAQHSWLDKKKENRVSLQPMDFLPCMYCIQKQLNFAVKSWYLKRVFSDMYKFQRRGMIRQKGMLLGVIGVGCALFGLGVLWSLGVSLASGEGTAHFFLERETDETMDKCEWWWERERGGEGGGGGDYKRGTAGKYLHIGSLWEKPTKGPVKIISLQGSW